ncbi:hypothetical protein I3843_Q047000 [Carya illinoinensis]|uniref:DUF761 domain-containing protein n=1 Tax=Carya illinoinensis TaxID=32201 RepID=A0A8T1QH86_CARIL|nr:uncharacterized protein LOC122311250 [Carya illinoinensis]KAG6653759.1 hypothetical protein CIPAW_05G098500 [Carya illinoinensis]KAG6670668.1 hypothetical protein I3843_Q047000 [Carya illinoinensis]
MKNKASIFLKQIISVLSSIAKAKSIAIKNKTSAAKARFLVFSLLKNKKLLLDSVSHKIHRILGQHEEESQYDADEQRKAMVLYNAMASESTHTHLVERVEEDGGNDDKYLDPRRSLFDGKDLDSDQDEEGGYSIIDMVRNSKEEGENFSLEDEIDDVADLFIKRFHKQMRLQKLASFKRLQAMMERGR